MAAFVPFLIALGGQAIRVGTQAAARYFAKKGAKKITEETAKKMGGRTIVASTADDAARMFAKYGKDIAKYRPATQVKPATKVVKPKPKPDTKPKDKPKSKVTPDRKPVRGSRIDVKPNAKKLKPDTKVVGSGRGGSRTTGAPSKRPTTAGAAAKRMPKLTRNQKIAAGLGVAGAATAVVDQLVKPKDAKSSPRKTSGPTTRGSRKPPSKDKPRTTSGPTTRGSRKPKSADTTRKTSGPTTRGSNRPKSADTTTRKSSGPATRGSNKPKRTNITAGPNTGFGPKGNIFPKNAEDRKRLMDLYGGTGSRAAKAAAAGTQGTLKKRK